MVYDPDYAEYALLGLDVRADQMPISIDEIFGDGINYKDSIHWQSPEGLFYGQTAIARRYYIPIVWTGTNYLRIQGVQVALTVGDLPEQGFFHFQVVSVRKVDATWEMQQQGRNWDYYFWNTDTQEWKMIEWLWTVENVNNLPYPGMGVGKAHIFVKHHQQFLWDGYKYIEWPAHSGLFNDESDRHLPEGFITNYEDYQTNTNGAIQFLQSQQAEARLEFLSKTNLGLLSSVTGKAGALWVNSELLLTDDVSNVENTDNVILYSNGTITTDTVDPNTTYYVYCGNSDFTACPSGLFLSLTPDINGRLGDETPGTNARIVGEVETDSAGYFVREIDISYIGRKVEFSQTFWEYSDYQLQFVDQDMLSFNRIDGTHGLVYINGQLLNFGTGKDLDRESYRIEWLDGPDIDTGAIAANTTYQVYIANDSVEFNFNNEDEETGLPYEEGHENYIEQLDFRRQMFLSTQQHDHRAFNQEYPGYYARHIGQVQTDENGLFRYAADISLIRQPTLNPTHLDGLAECVVQDVSTTQFKVIRKKGTTGIIYVGGKPVQTYDSDNPLVHVVTTSDALYEYDETEIDAPLTDLGLTVAAKPGIPLYLYMANDLTAWGGITTFCSLVAPSGGYLSTNWPGNQARWIATLQLSPATLGSEKVTNGSFATDTAWTKGTGWSYVSADQNMDHTPGNTATLSQNISTVAGELYACTFYISGRTAGIAAPRVGGTSGQSISGNTSSTQYLLAATTGNLEIVPDTYFDGTVDNVSVKKVETGQFSGTYVKDSVSGVSAQIDDAIVSSSTTYSSNKIEQIKQQLLGKIALALGLNGSHTSGLDLILEYVDSTTISLKANSSDVDVVFPNLETVTVTTAGITKTVAGNTSTLYYVYLVTDGTLAITTNAPTDVYSKISFYGDTHILVGWLAFSATNTISGTHNIYSFWNEPQRTWTQATSNFTETLDLTAFLVPPNKSASVSWGGTLAGSSVAAWDYFGTTVYATASTTQSASGTVTAFGYWNYADNWGVNRTQSLTLSVTSITSSVSNLSISASRAHSSTAGSQTPISVTNSWGSSSGTITLTRPGS